MRFLLYTEHCNKTQAETGGTRRFLELTYGLLRFGHTVTLLMPNSASIPEHPNLQKLVIVVDTKSRLVPRTFSNFAKNFLRLRKAVRSEVSAVICFDVPNAIQLFAFNHKPLIVFFRQDFVESKTLSVRSSWVKPIVKILAKIAERIIVRYATCIIFQCYRDFHTVSARSLISSAKIIKKARIIANNVNPSWVSKRELPQSKGIRGGRPRFLFVGRVDDPRKGFDIFFGALVKLKMDNVEVGADIIGSGSLDKTVEDYIRSTLDVSFFGYREDVGAFYSKCDVVVVSSRSDSCPNSALEGLFYKKVVIGAASGGIPEILLHKELLFEPSVGSLAEKMVALATNPKLYAEALGMCDERRVALTFDWAECTTRCVEEVVSFQDGNRTTF